ncbi:MAG: hypothetical protein BWY09_02999 [Candidatus Hydrogenedentes bacterium ADurb.Bin179]|nr:MAG: hypothetical protein BWY09_02999 [Candidatus Hydrogenedentes bacterium ADurb.Bin179]
MWQKLQVEIGRFKAGDRDTADYLYLPDLPKIDHTNICTFCGMRTREKSDGGTTDRGQACTVCKERIRLKEENKKAATETKTSLEMLYADHDFAEDLEAIAGVKTGDERASVAVVVMDLNDMGNRVKRVISGQSDKFETFGVFSKRLEEQLFTLFDGVLKTVFGNSPSLPCQPLLFAGDDVAFVMREDYWIPFVNEVFKGIKDVKPDGEPVTCGAGVVIAPHNFPINRLVDMAEELAGNAKRLFRHPQVGGKDAESVLDWHVFQESAFASALEARQRLFLQEVQINEEAYMATDKPYTASEFNTLCEGAEKFWDNLPETKRHGLYEALCYGPEATRDFLALHLLRDENDQLQKYDGIWQAVEEWKKNNKNGGLVLWHTMKTDGDGILADSKAPPGTYRKNTTLHYTHCADSMELYWMQQKGTRQ